jgi:predicted transcriptional regulator of viral defense system
MKFDDLARLLDGHAWFDLASLAQLSGASRHLLRVQLHRWCEAGKLVSLRRGYYAFAERYTGTRINPAELANALYSPSYLSTFWALGYYGLIPERVVTLTSVTSRPPRVFENAFGTFRYQCVKSSAFFGYRRVEMGGRQVLLASPEKALLDLWYLSKGPWGADRMEEMRFQNTEQIHGDDLRQAAARYKSPRLAAAVVQWLAWAETDANGTREL